MESNIVLEVDSVSFAYEEALVLKDIAFSTRHGDFMALVGPNGSGKTTLLKIILGTLIPRRGEVRLDGKAVLSYPPKERAKKMSYVSQQPFPGFPLTVQELVSLGRYPHEERFRQKPAETQAVEDALRFTDSLPLRVRKFTSLSGGERQKVLIARALAQTSYLLLLDEPTLHLDLYFQLEILNSLKRLCSEGRSTVVAVLHDLNLVSLFADKVLLLKSGEPIAFGTAGEVMNKGSLKDAFGVEVAVTQDSESGAVYYLPRRPRP
jgi:iron complex transport system ATP-binding protein